MSDAQPDSEKELATYKKTWGPLAQAAAWAAGIAGAFLTAPAQYTLEQSSTPAIVFLQFATAIVFGLAFTVRAGSRRKASRKRHLVYLGLSAATLVISFYSYFFLQQQWSCPYAQRFLIVTGSSLTQDAVRYLTSHPDLPQTCQSLLAEYAGDNLAIWESSSILVRHIFLTLLFSFAWLSCVSTLILTIEYIKAAASRERGRRPNASAN